MYIAKLLYIAADNTVSVFIVYVAIYQITDSSLQCFDAVGWAAGRASGL